MTFDEWCSQFRLTDKERAELVWFLATLRMRRTLEALIVQPRQEWIIL